MDDQDPAWISYDKREDWKDITPVYQTENERSVINIAYSQKFAMVFAYFRAILQTEEKSDRVWELTRDAALLNPANYTVWKYRRDLLTALNKDIADEFEFCRSVIDENPKNYQVWHHLRLLVEISGNFGEELLFTDSVIRDDSKNYHAWQHRQWVVKQFNLWENEINYSDDLLQDDIHNNSAWNYRFFIINSTTKFETEVVDREIKYTLAMIKKAPHNESSWNYLLGMTDHFDASQGNNVWEFCNRLYNEDLCRASHLLSFMVYFLTNAQMNVLDASCSKEHALKLLQELQEIDPIRKNYWQYLKLECK